MAVEIYPDGLLYHPGHAWARLGNVIATVGVTWYEQDQVGEVRKVDLPMLGQELTQGSPCARLESAERKADMTAPLSGEVIEVNPALKADPGVINASPYEAGWVVRLYVSNPDERKNLVESDSYRRLL